MIAPQLRFKEFSDKWQVKNLEELSEVTTGNKDTQNKLDDGEFPFFVRSQTVEKINSYTYDGEAVLTSGDGVGVGKNFHYINGKFDYHQRVYCIFNFKSQVSGKYIFYYFSEKFNKRVMGLSAKNSVDSVRRSMITEMPISIPTLNEQTKIANFLTAVDEKISQFTQKHDLLNQYKKGVMQQIFSQELRFKDDDGQDFPEWEEATLGEIVKFQNGKGHESIINEDGKYIVVNSKFIASSGKVFKCSVKALTPIASDTNVMVMSDVPNGKALGKCFFISEEDNRFTLNQRICALKSDKYHNKFLYYLINRNPHFLSFDSGVGQTNLKKEDVLSCPLVIPISTNEQTKIANFLTAIDDKITATQAQLKAVKQYKQGLLQQMFV